MCRCHADLATLQSVLDQIFLGLIGVRLTSVADDRVVAEMRVRPDLCTAGGILHGGAHMAFADTLGTVVNLGAGKRTTTTDSSPSSSRLVTEDADWVTVGGTRLQGRAQVESVHAALHAGQLTASRWTKRAHTVQALGSQAALLHLTWSVQGDLDADGTPRQPRNGIFTWLLAGQPGGPWRIRAAHAANVAVP